MRRSSPEVNAGSMADIAFLLLIFFLVTTTIETDSGINRKLPPMEELEDPPIIKQKNIFTVVVNKYNQLLVEEELSEIENLRSLAVKFLDNGEEMVMMLVIIARVMRILHPLIIRKKQLYH